jgi:ABC-type uncharacterized transport system substrate-binding protein
LAKNDHEISELVRLKPDVLVLPNPYRLEAGLKLTKSIPIVSVDLESDPVAKGFVKSLARPGGNVIGTWLDIPEIVGKHLQLLKKVIADLRQLAVVWDDRIAGLLFAAAEATAPAAGVTLNSVPLRDEREAEAAVKRVLPAGPQGLLMLTAPIVFRSQTRLAQIALRNRLPSISGFSTFPDSGGLMAYGANFHAIYRQVARYVDRLLKGASPSDLPVERPAMFELRINLKTAKALVLTIPPSLLGRADEVIQ